MPASTGFGSTSSWKTTGRLTQLLRTGTMTLRSLSVATRFMLAAPFNTIITLDGAGFSGGVPSPRFISHMTLLTSSQPVRCRTTISLSSYPLQPSMMKHRTGSMQTPTSAERVCSNRSCLNPVDGRTSVRYRDLPPDICLAWTDAPGNRRWARATCPAAGQYIFAIATLASPSP